MSLRDRAARDFQRFTSRSAAFGWAITLTAPDGTVQNMVGLSNDVSSTIDPETGMLVTGRTASVALSLLDLTDNEIPEYVADEIGKPWLVQFDDIAGKSYTFAVRESIPDRAVGSVVLMLETYTP